MRYVKNGMRGRIRIVAIEVIAVIILMGAAVITYADGPQLTTFSSGTTIKSSEVNQNFTNLSSALPGLKWTMATNPFTFMTAWQTVGTLSVTAPADGAFLIFTNTMVAFNLAPNGGNMVNFVVSTTTSSDHMVPPGMFGVSFVAPGTQSGPSLSVPANCVGMAQASAGVAATFYLLAQKFNNNADQITLQSASMFAVFLPKQW